jgi:hypothetical protein
MEFNRWQEQAALARVPDGAEIALRPVNLLKLEELIRPRQGAVVARIRQELAHGLAFGSNPAAQFRALSSLAS